MGDMAMLRKVIVRGDMWVFKREDMPGLFHRWGIRVGDDRLAVTVAIVELLDGTVIEAEPSYIRFVGTRDDK
jgi:hypothetical protein